MNGSCAGGTGAFIDQMATLLKMGAEEMDKAAQTAEKTYTIAAPLRRVCQERHPAPHQPGGQIRRHRQEHLSGGGESDHRGSGAGTAHQGPRTVSGRAADLFQVSAAELRRDFGRHRNLSENSLLFVALGAAFYAEESWDLLKTAELLEQRGMSETYRSQPPLFENEAEYEAFKARHAKAAVPQADFPTDYAKPSTSASVDQAPPR